MKSELIVDHNPKSPISEAIKNIRTNLQFSSVDGEVKNILVMSIKKGRRFLFYLDHIITTLFIY